MSDEIAFAMYFSSIVSMQHHPGAGTKDHRVLSLEECSAIALNMVVLHRELFPLEV